MRRIAEFGLASILFYIFIGDMSKFAAGFAAGVYTSTKFDFKPYVTWAEIAIKEKIAKIQIDIEKQKEIEKTIPPPPPEPESWISSWFKNKPNN
jgi:hypothetical protein